MLRSWTAAKTESRLDSIFIRLEMAAQRREFCWNAAHQKLVQELTDFTRKIVIRTFLIVCKLVNVLKVMILIAYVVLWFWLLKLYLFDSIKLPLYDFFLHSEIHESSREGENFSLRRGGEDRFAVCHHANCCSPCCSRSLSNESSKNRNTSVVLVWLAILLCSLSWAFP